MMRFQVRRESDGWHVYSPEIEIESSFIPHPTRLKAIYAITDMRDALDRTIHEMRWYGGLDA